MLRLVGILDRDEHGSDQRHAHAGAQLALGEGHVVGHVEAHHLAGRAHFGTEQHVHAGEAVEGENGFLYSNMAELLLLQLEAGQRLSPAMTRAAILATGRPITLATKGTVREARGLTSRT